MKTLILRQILLMKIKLKIQKILIKIKIIITGAAGTIGEEIVISLSIKILQN